MGLLAFAIAPFLLLYVLVMAGILLGKAWPLVPLWVAMLLAPFFVTWLPAWFIVVTFYGGIVVFLLVWGGDDP